MISHYEWVGRVKSEFHSLRRAKCSDFSFFFLSLQLSVLDTCALIMKIICLEIYYVVK